MALLVPKGDKQWLEKKGLGPVVEHEWWQNYTHETQEGNVILTFLPAHHWSAHGIFDRNKSLWGSWMISFHPIRFDRDPKEATWKDPIHSEEAKKREGEDVLMVSPSNHTQPARHSSEGATAGDVCNIYFAGDTAFSDHFQHIANEYSSIQAALMPIAPETPHPWMRKSHMDTHQAVQAFIDLKAHHFVPMHWGTFHFGLDTFHGPIQRLQEAWIVNELQAKKLIIAKVGQRLNINS